MARPRPIDPSASPEHLQLSLFSEVPDATPIDTLEKESTNGSNGRPDTSRAPDFGALEQVPSQDGRDLDGRESTPAGDIRSPGTDGKPAVRTGSSSQDGLPDRLGVGDEGMPARAIDSPAQSLSPGRSRTPRGRRPPFRTRVSVGRRRDRELPARVRDPIARSSGEHPGDCSPPSVICTGNKAGS